MSRTQSRVSRRGNENERGGLGRVLEPLRVLWRAWVGSEAGAGGGPAVGALYHTGGRRSLCPGPLYHAPVRAGDYNEWEGFVLVVGANIFLSQQYPH